MTGLLTLTGDSKGDKLALRLSSDATHLEVDVKDDGTPDLTFLLSLITSISVKAGAGNDTVRVDEGNGLLGKPLTIDGGPGNDTLIGGSGDDILIGGDGDDTLIGGRGSDVLFMGAGDDIAVWNPGDGSDTIEGQDGDDVLQFNGSNANEKIDVSANGARIRLTRDVGNITMDLNGVEAIDLSMLSGADTVTAEDLSGTHLALLNVDLDAAGHPGTGDGQADQVIVNGTPGPEVVSVGNDKGVLEVDGLAAHIRVANAEPANDVVQYVVLGADEVHVLGTKQADVITIAANGAAARTTVDSFPAPIEVMGGGSLQVFGLGGNDIITAGNGLAGTGVSLTIDGGAGNDTIVGGDGNDTLIGGNGNDVIAGGRGSDLILLGSGNDTAVWNPGDGSDTVEGGSGANTLQFNGANVSEKIDISRNGARERLTRDVGNINLDLNDIGTINLVMLGGADTITVNDMSGSDLKIAKIDLGSNGAGDGQADSVIVNGSAGPDVMNLKADANGVSVQRGRGSVLIQDAEPLLDHLTVNGGAGVDKIKAAPSVSTAIGLTINQD